MNQGNPNKVNAIVDEIVKDNNLFKLKSPIEQDKEKDSIAKSINSALSVLNEVGKELVLQELSVDPDEKFKGFIDSVGNVDISGLTQMTTTIVKAKIEEAEREGIDLRQGQTVFKDNTKSLLVGGILTVAVIDNMIRDFDKLSFNDRNALADNWLNMTNPQKFAYRKALGEMFQQKANVIDDEEIQEGLEQLGHEIQQSEDRFKQALASFNNLDNNEQVQWIEELIGRKLLPEEKNNNSLDKLFENAYFQRLDKQNKEQTNFFNSIENLEDIINNPDISNSDLEKLKADIKKQQRKVINSKEDDDYLLIPPNKRPIPIEEFTKLSANAKKQILASYIPGYMSAAKETTKTTVILNDDILQEIEQLPNKLITEGFSQEEIIEALTQYKTVLEQLPKEYIEQLKAQGLLDRKKSFNSILVSIGSVKPQIAQILSQIDYNGNLFNILENKEQRKDLLEQLDQIIEPQKEQQIKDEYTDAYYHSQNETLKVDGNVEKIVQEVQARGGSVEEITKALADTVIKHESEPVTQTQSEMYSFIDAEYLKQDSIEGLIPRNGENSQSLQDDKKAIFYSQGKEGAIVMYFEFLKQYERLKGSAGDKALEQYANYKNGTIELSDKQVQLLQGQLKQITQMRETKDFDEFMGDKLYLKLNGINIEQDRQAAEEWRASHPGTRMDYNYANSWTNSSISPDRIDVVSLQSKDGTDVKTSQKDLIKYFLSQTSIDKIEELGVNDTTLENIRKYYQEHSAEIAQMGEEYSVVTQNIQEFEQSRENSDFEKQTIKQEKDEETSQNMAMVEQDNSFIGKIKRVFANMKDMKNKDNSKGFFARLGASIQTVFGNKKEEFYTEQDEISTYAKTEDKIQPRTNPKQIDYLNQHFEVNTQEAIRKTEESKKSKEFLSTEDKTADKEEK